MSFSAPRTNPVQAVALPSAAVPDPTSPDAMAARAREVLLAKGRKGQNSTILTTPLGLTSNSASGSTLLGS